MPSGRRFAPAKLNLTLEVLARRSDGYHALRSVALPIALHDELQWTDADAFSFHCTLTEFDHADNLAALAARAAGIDRLPLKLTLHKHIPAGAGLGGGSSDSAAVLLAAIDGSFGDVPSRDWLRLARELGSDVPLFLTEAPTLLEGTGERVTALGAPPPWWAIVAHPRIAMSTSDAYRKLDEARTGISAVTRSSSISLKMVEALQAQDFSAVTTLLQNDFTDVVSAALPAVAELRAAFARTGTVASLSGSGSAVFGLCTHEAGAREVAAALASDARIAGAQIFCVPAHSASRWRAEERDLAAGPNA